MRSCQVCPSAPAPAPRSHAVSHEPKVSQKRARPSSPPRNPVAAMTKAELLAELTSAVPHASLCAVALAAPPCRAHFTRCRERGVGARADVQKARDQHALGLILNAERLKADPSPSASHAASLVISDTSPSVSPPPPDRRSRKVHFEPSPPPSDAHMLRSAEELFRHISSPFSQHQSVMQMLATAEQYHEYAAQLLAQAKQAAVDSLSQSRVVQNVAESCTQLQLKMDALSGHSIQPFAVRALTHPCLSSR